MTSAVPEVMTPSEAHAAMIAAGATHTAVLVLWEWDWVTGQTREKLWPALVYAFRWVDGAEPVELGYYNHPCDVWTPISRKYDPGSLAKMRFAPISDPFPGPY